MPALSIALLRATTSQAKLSLAAATMIPATYSGTAAFAGSDGTDGLGGGGGGGGSYSTTSFGAGGKGGDGVVIIRCNLPPKGFTLILK